MDAGRWTTENVCRRAGYGAPDPLRARPPSVRLERRTSALIRSLERPRCDDDDPDHRAGTDRGGAGVDGRLVAREQLPDDRADLPAGQRAAAASTGRRGHQAAPARALG